MDPANNGFANNDVEAPLTEEQAAQISSIWNALGSTSSFGPRVSRYERRVNSILRDAVDLPERKLLLETELELLASDISRAKKTPPTIRDADELIHAEKLLKQEIQRVS